MQKNITVGERTFVVRELLAIEMDDMDFNDKKATVKKQVILSTGISNEEYEKLTLKERLTIIQAINEVNDIDSFRQPA